MVQKKMYRWLGNHIWVNVMIVTAYFLAVVLLHEEVGRISAFFDKQLSRATYNAVLTCIALPILLLYCYLFFKHWKRTNRKAKLLVYLFVTISGVLVSYNVLLVAKVEMIHFAQYFLLALLLIPIVKRAGETVFWATILGAIDELYQYVVFNPDAARPDRPPKSYYDFNDVVLNMLGAALAALLVLALMQSFLSPARKPWWKSPAIYAYVSLFAIGTVLILAGILDWFPATNGESSVLLFSRQPLPESFWSVRHPNVHFHIMRPVEGLLIVTTLLVFYLNLDRAISAKKT